MSTVEKLINNALDRELQQLRAKLAWYEAFARRANDLHDDLRSVASEPRVIRRLWSLKAAYDDRPK